MSDCPNPNCPIYCGPACQAAAKLCRFCGQPMRPVGSEAKAVTCCICGGPAHPSTGAQYSPTACACYACVVSFWTWFRRQQHKRWSGADFYAAATRWM